MITKKDTILALCSPDINRRISRAAINSIKSTDLERAELFIVDNCYDKNFSHPETMNKMLQYAAKRNMNLVFLDDDVEIYRYDWLDRLHHVADDLDADIVSAIQVYPDGDINSIAEFVYSNGLTEPIVDFIHKEEFIVNEATYVPVLCSALMLVRNCKDYNIDTNYKKYKQDLDICMSAWLKSRKVGVALDMKVIHNRGYTGESNPHYKNILLEDSIYFSGKWKRYIEKILSLPELEQYKSCDMSNTWRRLYNFASKRKQIEPDIARNNFFLIAENSYIDSLISGSWWHLYTLDKDIRYLDRCIEYNPCHKAAKEILSQNGASIQKKCGYGYDCQVCVLSHVKQVVSYRRQGI